MGTKEGEPEDGFLGRNNMTSATAPLPAVKPLTLAERVTEHNAILERLDAHLAHLGRSLAAAEASGKCLSPTAYMIGVSRLADLQGELRESRTAIAAASRLAKLMEIHEAAEAAEFAAVPAEPVPVPHRHRKSRQDRDKRSLRALPGLALPGAAAFRGLSFKPPPVHHLLGHSAAGKVAIGSAAASALIVTAVSMPHAHTLEYDRGTGTWHAPAAVIWNAEPVPVRVLPSSSPTAFVKPEKPRKAITLDIDPVVTPGPVVAPVPAPVPAPTVTAPAPVDGGGGDQSKSPDWSPSSQQGGQPSDSYQSSDWHQSSDQSQQWQQSDQSQWQAQGRHAGPDSSDGNSGYQGRHGDNGSGSNYWQSGGQQQNAGWQNAPQQGSSWQGGGQQNGGWQHGNHGGY